MSNKHLSVESLYLYADHLFGYENWSHEIKNQTSLFINTFKYHVFAPMGRFQLELIYLYFPPSSHLIYVCFCPVGLSLL